MKYLLILVYQTKTLHALALGKTIIATNDGMAGVKINSHFIKMFMLQK